MQDNISYGASGPREILENVRTMHTHFPLAGSPPNSLLRIPDDMLLYLISIFRGEPLQSPDLTIPRWNELLYLLKSHWILPFLYYRIMHGRNDSLPPKEIEDSLRTAYYNSLARSIITDRQIGDIANTFEAEGIRVIFLKGAALARMKYPVAATRSGSDIDILVSPDDVVRARAVLERLGYAGREKYFDMQRNLFYEEGFYHRDPARNYLLVELHWKLNPLPVLDDYDLNNFFARAVKVKSSGLTFYALSPIDNIVHLALHWGLKHNENVRLSWIQDISLLCKDLTDDDWKTLQERSVECNARISLENLLTMAQLWTGLQIPSEFSDFTKWAGPRKSETVAYDKIHGRMGIIDKYALYWPRSAHIFEKAEISFYLTFPPIESMREQYRIENAYFTPIYYLKRWIGFLIR